ncbi:hypothetical protein GLAREA_09753 [Glarea lozoyensis ATCC 20868]|uniref:Uncharacterized protein n=1 Tax=Glarea lozoyensis (strain ATCC 20868 / MF5171) TaxID=1116229 RepID=S3CQ72_GLAL2|nr:uncharacterized protein GLAREA_09753 [Glarea lozoyensis ATCC 20868]EPE28632.1 hypothetical protein GLAREA_09753 [Glarea lozoyensis ATCC 20868]
MGCGWCTFMVPPGEPHFNASNRLVKHMHDVVDLRMAEGWGRELFNIILDSANSTGNQISGLKKPFQTRLPATFRTISKAQSGTIIPLISNNHVILQFQVRGSESVIFT